MIEADPRLDAGGQQRIDQAVVEGEARLICRAPAGRQNARPGDREAISPYPEVAHQRDVLREAMVMIARDVAGITVGDAAFLTAERVPDAGPAAVLADRPLDLIARGGNAPHEVVGHSRLDILPCDMFIIDDAGLMNGFRPAPRAV